MKKEKEEIVCFRCGNKHGHIRKMWNLICGKCRVVLKDY